MPANSVSIYDVDLDANLEEISNNLQGLRVEQISSPRYGRMRLLTVFSDIVIDHGALFGSIAYETPITIQRIDAGPTTTKAVKRLSFALYSAPHSFFLLCFANRPTSNAAAGKIENALHHTGLSPNEVDTVLKHRIPSTFIEDFLNNHPNHTMKLCGWKGLTFVGVDTSNLNGSNIYEFNGAQNYDAHGEKSYVMVELHDLGLTVRISDEGIVTFFGDIDRPDMLDFLDNEVFPTLP